jgi:2-hydroxycyclohexanecarboxyl-CoA dehydrogenase
VIGAIDDGLSDRVVVVTGGTAGVGRAVVQRLAASGAQVVFQGRDRAAADGVIASVSPEWPTPLFVSGDFQRYEDVEALCDAAVRDYGRLDGAVASGMQRDASVPWRLFRQTPPEQLGLGFELVMRPRLYLAHAAAQRMAPAGYGKIVLLTSDAGRVPTPAETVIGAAAAGVIYLARTLGRELARDGVRINCLSMTLTEGTDSYAKLARPNTEDPALVRAFDRLKARAAFGLGDCERTAALVSLLLCPVTDGISGATWSLNQGAYFPAYA